MSPIQHHHTDAELNDMSRKELQALAKQYGIKANGKTSELIEALVEYGNQRLQPQAVQPSTSRPTTPASAKAKLTTKAATPVIKSPKRLSNGMHDVVMAELEQRVQQHQPPAATTTMQTPQVKSKTSDKTSTAVKASGGIRYKFEMLHQQQHDSEPSIVDHQQKLQQRVAIMQGNKPTAEAAAAPQPATAKRSRDADATKLPVASTKKAKLSTAINTPSITKPVPIFNKPAALLNNNSKSTFALNDTFKVKQLKHQRQNSSSVLQKVKPVASNVGRNPLADTSNTEFVFNVAPHSSFAVGVKNAVVNGTNAVRSTVGAIVRRLSGKGSSNVTTGEAAAVPQKFVSDKRTNELAERYRQKQAERQAQLKAMVYSREKQEANKQSVQQNQLSAKQKVIASHRRL